MNVKSASFFVMKKNAKPVVRMSNPDESGPMIVDRETLFRLMADQTVTKQPRSL